MLTFEAFINRKLIHFIAENGVFLWPSEWWFIVVGNGILFTLFCMKPFRIKVRDSMPLFIIVFVLFFGFLHGLLKGNQYVMGEFREVCLHSMCLPPILFFFPHLNLFKCLKFCCVALLPITAFWILLAFKERVTLQFEITSDIYAFCLLTIFAFCLIKVNFKRGMYAFPAILFFVALISQFSKSITVSLIICYLLSLYLSSRINFDVKNLVLSKFNLKLLFYLITATCMFLVAVFLFDKFSGGLISFVINSEFLKQRLTESGSMTQGNLSGGRLEMWEAGILYWLESPFIGHGMGSVVSVYSQGWNDKSQLHNYLVQYLQNLGFSGVLIILLSWLKFFATVWRKLNHESCLESRMAMSSLIVFIIVIMLIGLFSHPLAIPTVSILFWMSLGCLCSPSSSSHGFVKPRNTTLKPNYTF